RHHHTGKVIVAAHFDANGHAQTVEPTADSPERDGLLVEAATDAVKRWTFQPESVEGHGVPGTVKIPFCFFMNRPSSSACDWMAPGQTRPVADGEAFASDPVAKLASDVVGKTL